MSTGCTTAEYRHTSQMFTGINLLKIVGVECFRHSNGGAEGTDGSASGEGLSPSPVGLESRALEKFFHFVL